MIMCKKITALILSVTLILTLTSCSGGSENGGESTASDNTTTAPAENIGADGNLSDMSDNSAEYDEKELYDIVIEGTTVLSASSKGGYTARLELEDIVKTPDGELNAYQAITRVMFTLNDENGNRAYALPNIAQLAYGGTVGAGVWADCAENAVEIYEIEWNGEKKHVLRCCISYGTENGAYPQDDPELYHARFYVCDLDAAYDGEYLRAYNIGGMENGDFYISDSLVYKGENVLRDEKRKIDISFDPDSFIASYVSYDE